MPKKTAKVDQIWPRVRPAKNKDGSTSYMVDTRLAGRGKRLFYDTKTEAQTVAEQMRIKRRNEGDSAFEISAADRIDAENALRVLRAHGITLKQAADFSIRHLSTVLNSKAVSEVVEELVEKVSQDGLSRDYLYCAGSLWRRFAKDHSHLMIGNIDAIAIDKWLRELEGVSGASRNDYARRLTHLFGYAVKSKYAVENPMKNVERAKIKRGMPEALSIPQVIDLLRSADATFMPCLLVGLFAGLRPLSEVCRLRWERINFETKQIYVAPGCSKNNSSVRYVYMSDNLVEWLLPYRQASGALIKSRAIYQRRHLRTTIKAGFAGSQDKPPALVNAGISKHGRWPKDGFRHTYCSMHLAKHKNLAETVAQMGHTGSNIIFKHYRAIVTSQEAEVFWEISPEILVPDVEEAEVGNILPMLGDFSPALLAANN